MKKVLSAILAASLITSLFAACGTEKKSGDSHTLYFRDASKSKEAVATFFNSDTGESTEVKMERGSEDDEAVTFTCEGNTSEYNMAYITYDSISTDKFAFNKCTSGWYNSDHGFLPYTYGREINYRDSYDDVTLTCNGYDKTAHIWTPDDYDPKSDEKYSTVYLLDGTSMVFLGFDGMQLTDSELANEQVRAMTSVTGKKAIIVAVETFGDNNNYTRDDELIPDLGKMAHQARSQARPSADSGHSISRWRSPTKSAPPARFHRPSGHMTTKRGKASSAKRRSTKPRRSSTSTRAARTTRAKKPGKCTSGSRTWDILRKSSPSTITRTAATASPSGARYSRNSSRRQCSDTLTSCKNNALTFQKSEPNKSHNHK